MYPRLMKSPMRTVGDGGARNCSVGYLRVSNKRRRRVKRPASERSFASVRSIAPAFVPSFIESTSHQRKGLGNVDKGIFLIACIFEAVQGSKNRKFSCPAFHTINIVC